MSSDIYIPENVPIFEAIYGKGLISLGGNPAIDNLFKNLSLEGKHLLDIGSGIGGMAHYLAQRYNCHVTGLEVQPWMSEYALSKTPKEIASRTNFISYSGIEPIPLADNSIDIICSKGVLTNIENKRFLFNNIFRVLKPKGIFRVVDWLSSPQKGPLKEKLHLGDFSNKETQDTYTNFLKSAGFKKIQFDDVTKEYLTYIEDYHQRLSSQSHIDQYASIISDALRKELLIANEKTKASILKGEQLSMKITAHKD